MAYNNCKEMADLVTSLNPLVNNDTELCCEHFHAAFDLEAAASHNTFAKTLPTSVVRLLAVSLMGYMTEVHAGNGLWQVFLRKNHELYGCWLPFGYDAAEDYAPGNLNRGDVQYIIWYVLAGMCERQRYLYPLSADLNSLTDALWTVVKGYEGALPPLLTTAQMREVGPARMCELLYWRHWLLLPAFEQDRQSRVVPLIKQIEHSTTDAEQRTRMLSELHHDIMASLPTGPLALGISDWVAPLLGMRRKTPKTEAPKPEHKYYTQFMKATNGHNPYYIADYEELNNFLSDDMGWGREEHFPAMRHHRDFALLADHDNGLLICKDVARCIADPANELYDPAYAAGHAFTLLAERGKCAPDLLKLLLAKGWLPDTMFPTGSADEQNLQLTIAGADALARFYLQQYYTGD